MNTRPLTDLQSQVLTMINVRSKENPITSHELMTFLEIKDKDGKVGANLRSVINSIRDKGYPVCASNNGYYYPQSPEELQEYIESFKRRIEQQVIACEALEERYSNWIIIRNQKRQEEETGPIQERLI